MTIARLAVQYRGRLLLPVLGPVTSTGYTDRLHVRLVSGQSPDDFALRAGNLAHAFAALSCRIRTASPGSVVVELVRRDALAAIIPALPVPAHTDLTAVPVGRRKTAHRGRSGCTAPTCCSPGRPAPGRRRCCGGSSAACSPPFRTAPCGSSARIRS